MNKSRILTTLLVAGLVAGASTSIASADGDAGYNTSTSSTTVIGSDRNSGGATAEDYARMQATQEALARLRQTQQRPSP